MALIFVHYPFFHPSVVHSKMNFISVHLSRGDVLMIFSDCVASIMYSHTK